MIRPLQIPHTLVYVAGGFFDGEDCPGYILYMPAHDHYAGDGLPCTTSILMVL